MKKGLTIGIALITTLSLAACGNSQAKSKKSESSSISTNSTKNSNSTSTKNNSISNSTTNSSSSISKSSNSSSSAAVSLTDDQKSQVESAFMSWASGRAKTGNMAVSDWYFDHGSAGFGDWYANTPDGEVQVQDNNHPGNKAFKIHAVGGCVFYTSIDGSTGQQNAYKSSFADNYSASMRADHPVIKYMLGDNGVVYELKLDGNNASTNSGFGEYDDDGSHGDYGPTESFSVSQDTAAQTELKNLLAQYK